MNVLYLFGCVMAFVIPITLFTVCIIWALNKWG